MHSSRKLAWLFGASLAFATACGDDNSPTEPVTDAGSDGALYDAGSHDGAVADASGDAHVDGGAMDASNGDAGNEDAGSMDAAPADSGTEMDANTADVELVDSAAPNDNDTDAGDADVSDAEIITMDASDQDAASEADAEVDGATEDAQSDAGEPPVRSTFDANDEGWIIGQNSQAGDTTPVYASTGGNPGGYISAVDAEASLTWNFYAPSAFRGDHSSMFGKTLSFDLKTTAISSPFSAPDVVLEGGGLLLVYDLSADPGTDWTHYSAPLSAQGWHVDSLSGAEPTSEQFQAVLADITGLTIRGEYNLGADTGSLDNVELGGTQ
ncbi:MAG TPA: laminin B domain-containing protein [Polyangiaceae bacterium]|nr:laminin B domain-containing protein [Polyangiaceae bacterium]